MPDWTWTSSPKASRSPGRILARALEAANRSPRTVTGTACVLLAAPALDLGSDAFGIGGTLGVNPLETLIRMPARWALIWLLAALAMAPLRQVLVRCARWGSWRYGKRLSDWNWVVRPRRQVGLACFFYSTAHFAFYAWFDLGMSWSEFTGDLLDKPYIDVGIASFLLLLPLAITSTDAWMRRLQRNWKRLHMLVYPAALLAMAHFLLLTKPGVADPMPYALTLAVLLACKLAEPWLQSKAADAPQERIDGLVPERPARTAAASAANAVDAADDVRHA
jgi:methionine sulfoxide reductase heme-binding subunit